MGIVIAFPATLPKIPSQHQKEVQYIGLRHLIRAGDYEHHLLRSHTGLCVLEPSGLSGQYRPVLPEGGTRYPELVFGHPRVYVRGI